jgi:hypothetical protein
LDATFCSEEYSKTLSCPTKCILLESSPLLVMNHWTILNSRALSQALDEHLPWLWDPSTTTSSTADTPRKASRNDAATVADASLCAG